MTDVSDPGVWRLLEILRLYCSHNPGFLKVCDKCQREGRPENFCRSEPLWAGVFPWYHAKEKT